MKCTLFRRATRVGAAALLTAAVLFPGGGVVHAQTWSLYRNTAAPLGTTGWASSNLYNQNVYNTDLTLCSSGTWTKYIDIQVSGSVPFKNQSTNCTGVGPVSYAVANGRSVCKSISTGTRYANCYVLRD